MTWQEVLNMITGKGNQPSQLSQLASQIPSGYSAPSPSAAYDLGPSPVAGASATLAPKSATSTPTTTTPPGSPAPNPQPKATGGSGSNPAATSTPTNTGDPITSQFEREYQAARSAYEEGLRRASAAFEQAQRVYNQGREVLNTRKGEFHKNYDTGNNDILTSYEGERGNTQASAQAAADRSQAILRAMGLGGSALVKSTLKNTQNNAKALGQLNASKSTNENANLGAFNENNLWASNQESTLQNALQAAQEARTAAENQSGLLYTNDQNNIAGNMNNFYQRIMENQMAIDAAKGGITSKTANPFAVNIDNVSANLNSTLNGGSPTTASTTPASNVVADNSLQAILKRLRLV